MTNCVFPAPRLHPKRYVIPLLSLAALIACSNPVLNQTRLNSGKTHDLPPYKQLVTTGRQALERGNLKDAMASALAAIESEEYRKEK